MILITVAIISFAHAEISMPMIILRLLYLIGPILNTLDEQREGQGDKEARERLP
jgi:hypothetical protein